MNKPKSLICFFAFKLNISSNFSCNLFKTGENFTSIIIEIIKAIKQCKIIIQILISVKNKNKIVSGILKNEEKRKE